MSTLSVEPVTPNIGALISGLDLREPLGSDEIARIEQALLDHLVIFFRNQPITAEQHVAFARQFGEISIAPISPNHGGPPELFVLDQVNPEGEGADNWHSDNTFMPEPPMGSILKAVELPSSGGDTCFASAYAAYDALSPAMQELADGLRAVHDITKPVRRAIAAGIHTVDLEKLAAAWPPVEHPVVRTHPVTGRKALYVNGNSTTHLVGLTERENDLLLPFLCDHIRSPAFQCRFQWDVDSIAFWDNRSAQHFAVPDYHERRLMNRVTLLGDKPR